MYERGIGIPHANKTEKVIILPFDSVLAGCKRRGYSIEPPRGMIVIWSVRVLNCNCFTSLLVISLTSLTTTSLTKSSSPVPLPPLLPIALTPSSPPLFCCHHYSSPRHTLRMKRNIRRRRTNAKQIHWRRQTHRQNSAQRLRLPPTRPRHPDLCVTRWTLLTWSVRAPQHFNCVTSLSIVSLNSLSMVNLAIISLTIIASVASSSPLPPPSPPSLQLAEAHATYDKHYTPTANTRLNSSGRLTKRKADVLQTTNPPAKQRAEINLSMVSNTSTVSGSLCNEVEPNKVVSVSLNS